MIEEQFGERAQSKCFQLKRGNTMTMSDCNGNRLPLTSLLSFEYVIYLFGLRYLFPEINWCRFFDLSVLIISYP